MTKFVVRKADFIGYAHEQQLTLTNLVDFVLANSKQRVRWLSTFQLLDLPTLARHAFTAAAHERQLDHSIRAFLRKLYELHVDGARQNIAKAQIDEIHSCVAQCRRALQRMFHKMKQLRQLLHVLHNRLIRFDEVFRSEITDELLKFLKKVQDELRPAKLPKNKSANNSKRTSEKAAKLPTNTKANKSPPVVMKVKEELPDLAL